jgi:hypothetical protein
MDIIIKKLPLTKKLISQMPSATKEVLENGDVLGMVINVVKDSYKSAIIAYKDEYYWHSIMYTKGERTLYRRIGKWTSVIEFETKDECDEYWEVYSKIRDIAFNKHLYI